MAVHKRGLVNHSMSAGIFILVSLSLLVGGGNGNVGIQKMFAQASTPMVEQELPMFQSSGIGHPAKVMVRSLSGSRSGFSKGGSSVGLFVRRDYNFSAVEDDYYGVVLSVFDPGCPNTTVCVSFSLRKEEYDILRPLQLCLQLCASVLCFVSRLFSLIIVHFLLLVSYFAMLFHFYPFDFEVLRGVEGKCKLASDDVTPCSLFPEDAFIFRERMTSKGWWFTVQSKIDGSISNTFVKKRNHEAALRQFLLAGSLRPQGFDISLPLIADVTLLLAGLLNHYICAQGKGYGMQLAIAQFVRNRYPELFNGSFDISRAPSGLTQILEYMSSTSERVASHSKQEFGPGKMFSMQNFQPMGGEAPSSFFHSVVVLISVSIACFGYYKKDAIDFDEAMSVIKAAMSGRLVSQAVTVTTLISEVKKVFESVQCFYQSGYDIKAFFGCHSDLSEISADLACLRNSYDVLNVRHGVKLSFELQDMQAKARQLKERLASMVLSYPARVGVIRRLQSEVVSFAEMLDARVKSADVEKVAPFAIAMVGNSSIGKTQLIHALASQFRLDNPFLRATTDQVEPLDKSGEYWHTIGNGVTDAYFNGLTNSHHTLILDDVAVSNPKVNGTAGAEMVSSLIHLINSAYFMTPQAALEDKGNIFSFFQFILLTSNSKDLGANLYASHPAAVLRRINLFIEPSVKDDFRQAGTTMVDSRAVHEYCARNGLCGDGIANPLVPIHTFDVWTYRVNGENPTKCMLKQNIEIGELIQFLRDEWHMHAKNQVLTQRMNSRLAYQACPSCGLIGYSQSRGCTCDRLGSLCGYSYAVLAAPVLEEMLKFILIGNGSYLTLVFFVLGELFLYVCYYGSSLSTRLIVCLLHGVWAGVGQWSLPVAMLAHASWNNYHIYNSLFIGWFDHLMCNAMRDMCVVVGVFIMEYAYMSLSFTTRLCCLPLFLVPNYTCRILLLCFYLQSFDVSMLISVPILLFTQHKSSLAMVALSGCVYQICLFFWCCVAHCFLTLLTIQIAVRQVFGQSQTWCRIQYYRACGVIRRMCGRLYYWRRLTAIACLITLIGCAASVYYFRMLTPLLNPHGNQSSQPLESGRNVWTGSSIPTRPTNPGVQVVPFATSVVAATTTLKYGQKRINIFGVDGNYYICTQHEARALFSYLGAEGKRVELCYNNMRESNASSDTVRFGTPFSKTREMVFMTEQNVLWHASKDFAVICCPNGVLRKRLVNYFPSIESRVAHNVTLARFDLESERTILLRCAKLEGGAFPVHYKNSEMKKMQDLLVGPFYEGDRLITSQVGDCGAVCYQAMQGHCSILGIHVAGTEQYIGIIPVMKEELVCMIDELRQSCEYKVTPRVSDDAAMLSSVAGLQFEAQGPPHPKSCFNFVGEAVGTTVEHVGSMGSQAQFSNRNTKFAVSRFVSYWSSKVLYRAKTASTTDVDLGGLPMCEIGAFHPPRLLDGMSWLPKARFARVVSMAKELMDVSRIHQLARSYVEHCVNNVEFLERLRMVQPLSHYEAINGRPGAKYVKSMNMQSSAGFPHCKAKYLVCEQVGTDPNEYDFTDTMMDRVREMEFRARSGARPGAIFTATLKDEMLPEKKVRLPGGVEPSDVEAVFATSYGKIRVFQGCNIEMTYLVRKYFLALVSCLQEYRFVTCIAVGLNCFSKEWSELYDYLNCFGNGNYICGDFSNYDQRMGREWLYAAWGVLIDLLMRTTYYAGLSDNEKSEYRALLSAIADDISNPLVNMFGDFYRLNGSNASGHPLTVIVNCIANVLYMKYAFEQVYPDKDFFACVRMMAYGDDNILGVSSECDEFTQPAVSMALAQINVVYTSATKSTVSSDYDPSPTFLKRRWLHRDYEGSSVVVCPIEFASIQKMLATEIRKDVAYNRIRYVQVLVSAAFEFIQYGRSNYEQLIAFAEEFIHANDLLPEMRAVIPRGWPDYDAYMQHWVEGTETLDLPQDQCGDLEFE